MKCVASQSKLIDDIRRKNTRQTCHFFLVVVASVLADKFGYTKERIIRVLNEMNEMADSINKGYLNLDDLEKVLKDEYNITIGGEK